MKSKIIANHKLKFYHWLILALSIPVFGFFALFYGWVFYSTISNRNGVWGTMYYCYDLTKEQFILIRLLISFTLIVLIIFQLKYFIEKNVNRLNKTLMIAFVFIAIWIIVEVYLQIKFIGKG